MKNNKEGLLPYDKRGINIPALEKGIHTQTDSIIICHCLKRCRRHQEKHLKEHLVIRTKVLSGALFGKQKRRKYHSRKTMRKLPTFT